MTKIIKGEEIGIAIKCLKKGGIIAFPTETVYGIGTDGTNSEAYFKIYEIKKREKNKPIPFFIEDISYLETIACNIPKEAYLLGEKFWPGPLTMILYSSQEFSWVGKKIAIRIPNHKIPLLLLKNLKKPMAVTSANISGKKEVITPDEIKDLKINLIINGGKVNIGIPSTIVDMTEKPRILRYGAIHQEVLRWIEK